MFYCTNPNTQVRKVPPAYLIPNSLALTTAATSGGIWLLSLVL